MLPHFSLDIETSALPESFAELRQQVAADGLVIACSGYAHGIRDV
ncbi:hypothetical protein [Microvirga makkahensis]|nr:hypothetical protein [Microvirga makkahensis]